MPVKPELMPSGHTPRIRVHHRPSPTPAFYFAVIRVTLLLLWKRIWLRERRLVLPVEVALSVEATDAAMHWHTTRWIDDWRFGWFENR